MTKRKILFTVGLALICFAAGAQNVRFVPVGPPSANADMVDANKDKLKRNYSVSGYLVDSLFSLPLPFAGIAVMDSTGYSLITQGLTDEDGHFKIYVDDPGKYLVRIVVFGTDPVDEMVVLNNRKRNLDLGTFLINSGTNIEEIRVKSTKRLIKVDMDKIIYNVADDPASKGMPLFDVMKSVPLVSTDFNDNLTLNGQGSFMILVDGKRNAIFWGNSFALSTVLKSYPAESIHSIEVLTVPPPKYEAEGVGGIINIVTKKSKVNGYTVGITSNGNTLGAIGGAANVTGKINKFSFSLYGNLNRFTQGKSESWSARETLAGSDRNRQKSHSYSESISKGGSGSLSMSYDVDSLRLITAGASISVGRRISNNSYDVEVLDQTGGLVQEYSRTADNSSVPNPNYSASLDYQRSFRKKERMLTFSYEMSGMPSTDKSLYTLDDILSGRTTVENRIRNESSVEQTGQIDYYDVFSERHAVGAGVKYIFRNYGTDSENFLYDAANDSWYEDESYISDDLSYKQQVGALYGSYTLKGSKIGARAGFRAEYSRNDAIAGAALNQATKFSNDFFNFIPNVSFFMVLSQSQNINAGYTQRIGRPSIYMLNPYRDDSNPSEILQGNPELIPEIAHSFNLQWGLFHDKHSASLSFSALLCNNKILMYSTDNPELGVIETKYGNVGKRKDYTLYAYYSFRPNEKLSLNLNANYGYISVGNAMAPDLYNSGWQGSLDARISLGIWKKGGLNANFNWSTSRVLLQGEGKSEPHYSFQVFHNFLNNKLRLSINITRPFSKYTIYNKHTVTSTFNQSFRSQSPGRTIGFFISYSFGKMNERVKKVSRSVENDDLLK